MEWPSPRGCWQATTDWAEATRKALAGDEGDYQERIMGKSSGSHWWDSTGLLNLKEKWKEADVIWIRSEPREVLSTHFFPSGVCSQSNSDAGSQQGISHHEGGLTSLPLTRNTVCVAAVLHLWCFVVAIILVLVFFFFLVRSNVELRALHLLQAYKAGALPLEPCFQSILLWLFWRWGSTPQSGQMICPGWPQTMILSISASQLARIKGMSHPCLTLFSFLFYFVLGWDLTV
jgi:hypothetical protein